jgi:hypothetical protein
VAAEVCGAGRFIVKFEGDDALSHPTLIR